MRVRIRFTKHGKVRFTSHRDVARMWERALRRAALPVARTEGFNPRPKVHFGLALSTGHESDAEYLDVDLVTDAPADDPAHDATESARPPGPDPVDLGSLPARLSLALPKGLEVTAVAVVPPGTPSLQQSVTSSRWEIEVLGLDLARLTVRAGELLAADELVMTRQRKGRDVSDDVRPHLLHLEAVAGCGDHPMLLAELGTLGRALRPGELVALVGPDAREGKVRRTHQFTEHDGQRSEPLTVGAPDASIATPGSAPTAPPSDAPHAAVRAS